MKKICFILASSLFYPISAWAEGWNFAQSGTAGIYYGATQTRENNNIANRSDRTVFRADGKLEALYEPDNGTHIGAAANYTVVIRQHDKDYGQGDWRFYPYMIAENENYGRMTVGYTYNAAALLHLGAQDISWLNIQDSNLTYYLSSANWSNGFKRVRFFTPKSTRMIDDGRAPKISYFTPMLGNTQFGFSYTPDNANRRGMVSRYVNYETKEDGYTAAMKNHWKLALGDLYTSAAYGLFNRTDKEWAFGARWVVGKFNISAAYKNAYVDGHKNPIATKTVNAHLPAYFDNYRESQAWDFSMGYDFGRFKTNLAYLHVESKNTRNRDDLVVQTNRFALNEWFELFWINAYINSKGFERNTDDNNKGYAVITGLALKY